MFFKDFIDSLGKAVPLEIAFISERNAKYVDISKLDLYHVCQNFSEEFLLSYPKLNLASFLGKDLDMDEEFLNNYDIWDGNSHHPCVSMAQNKNLSLDFISKYLKGSCLEQFLINNPQMTVEFVEQNFVDKDLVYRLPLKDQKLQQYLDHQIERDPDYKLSDYFLPSIAFMEKNYDRIDFKSMYRIEKVVSEEFLERHLSLMSIGRVWRSPNLSQKFIEKYFSRVNMYDVIFNPNLDFKFVIKNLDIFFLDEIRANPSLPHWFITKYFEKTYIHSNMPLKCLFYNCPKERLRLLCTQLTRNDYLEEIIFRHRLLNTDF